MTDELLAYLLDDLPAERRATVERRLAVDPQWRRELDRLKKCLGYESNSEPDSGESETPAAPPDDLVDRTCCLVEKVCGNQSSDESVFSESSEDSGRSRWSLADVAVGAGVALILASLLMPAMRQSRDTSRLVACQNNLRTLGTALFDYAQIHQGRLPHMEPRENAGAYAIKLADAGMISREQLASTVVCPDAALADQVRTRRVTFTIPSHEQLAHANGKVLLRLWRRMGGSYAYRLGYFDEDGKYHQVKFTGNSRSPLLADEPTFNVVGLRSANHGGKGQNVINQDLSAKYVTTWIRPPACNRDGCDTTIDDANDGDIDNLVLNKWNTHAAGIGPDDVVLGRSEYTPLGKITPVSQSLTAGCSTSPLLWIAVTRLNERVERSTVGDPTAEAK